jgi:PatG C-terminal
VVPRDPVDYNLLVEALRPTPQPWDLDCVIGFRGPVAGPELCNGLMVPIVVFDQIYSFDRDTLIKAIPRPEKTTAKDFAPAAEELFDRIMQMTDNAGATDEHRALNYLAVRYHAIYANAAEAFARNASLTGVDVALSPLSGTRKVMDVIFSHTNRNTDVVEKFFTRVDVTEEFPFLVTKLSPYYDR